jgi:hypothetical protein
MTCALHDVVIDQYIAGMVEFDTGLGGGRDLGGIPKSGTVSFTVAEPAVLTARS